MDKIELIQTAKAAAEVVLEFVKWYERRSQSVAYMKGESKKLYLVRQARTASL